MALRRGEGIGDDGSSAFNDSPWDSKVQFPGSHFHDPNMRALIIIYGICFVAALAIAMWATVVEKYNRPLRWGILIFSVSMYIIYLGNHFAYLTLYDQGTTVRVVYLLIDTILESSVYLAGISLLSFIYIVIAVCLQDLGVKAPVKTALKISSFVLISSLIAFWAAILALQIIYHVNSVIDSIKIDPGEELVWTKIEIAYHATFVFASIKLLAFALWIISGQRKLRNPTWIGIFLASLVAIPLLIRSAVYLGFSAVSLTRDIELEARVAKAFITNICFVLAYSGVLLVAMRFKKEGPLQVSQHGALNHPVFGDGAVTYGGATYGNRSYGSHQQLMNGTTWDYGNPRYPQNDGIAAYQAQNQYNTQHSPVSPWPREKVPLESTRNMANGIALNNYRNPVAASWVPTKR